VLEFQNGKRRITRVSNDGTVGLENELTGEESTVPLPKLLHLVLGGVVKDGVRLRAQDANEDKYTTRSKPAATPEAEADRLRRLQTVSRRIAYVNALCAEGPIGPKHAAFEACLRRVAECTGDKCPPSPWTAYRWLSRYRSSGFNPDVLARQELFVRTRKPKVSPEIKATIARHLSDLLARGVGPSLHSVTDLALALTARDLGRVQFRDKYGRMQVALTFISEAERLLQEQRAAPQPFNGAVNAQELHP
jgi:hypothetical protein